MMQNSLNTKVGASYAEDDAASSPGSDFEVVIGAIPPELIPKDYSADASIALNDGGTAHVSAGATLATLGVACISFAIDARNSPGDALIELSSLFFATDAGTVTSVADELRGIRSQVQAIAESPLHDGLWRLRNAAIARWEADDAEVDRQLTLADEDFGRYRAVMCANDDPAMQADAELWLAAVAILRAKDTLAAQALREAVTCSNEAVVRGVQDAKVTAQPLTPFRGGAVGRRVHRRALVLSQRELAVAVSKAKAVRQAAELLNSTANLDTPLPPAMTVDDTLFLASDVAEAVRTVAQRTAIAALRGLSRGADATARAAEGTARQANRVATHAAGMRSSMSHEGRSRSEDREPEGSAGTNTESRLGA